MTSLEVFLKSLRINLTVTEQAQDLFRNRQIDPKTLDKYFKTGQGDPSTFERDLQRVAVDQNMDPQTALMIKQAASQRIPQLRSLQRRMQ